MFCFFIFVLIGTLFCPIEIKQDAVLHEESEFVAFLRVKNEINTIEACLNSIDKVFDRIVIIHSDEPDDGSIEVMNKWCEKRSYCEIHEYPYMVISQHDPRMKGKVKPENTLASYYNFGLTFFKPNDWVVKVDGDQIYIKEKLKQTFEKIKNETKENDNDNFAFFVKGWNTLIWNKSLVLKSEMPIMGSDLDQFIIKRKYIPNFIQGRYWERSVLSNSIFVEFNDPIFFHFQDNCYKEFNSFSTSELAISKITPLNEEQISSYKKYILPLLIQTKSPYKRLRLRKYLLQSKYQRLTKNT